MELKEHRKKASDLSLGSSHEVIYKKAIELLDEYADLSSHLDFGSGQGTLLKRIDEGRNVQLTGADLMGKPEGYPERISWSEADLNDKMPFQDNHFTSISAIEIIEHLENPRHVFRELLRILKPKGTLVMSTPNNESMRSMVSFWKRGHFVAFTDRDYPAHITALNRKDLQRAADEAGFELVTWAYSDFGCLPGVTSMSWQNISFGALKGLRYSDNLFVVLRKP